MAERQLHIKGKQPETKTARAQSGLTRAGLSRDFCVDLASLLNILVIAVSALVAAYLSGEQGYLVRYLSIGVLGGLAATEIFIQGGYQTFDRLLSPWRALRGLVWRWAWIIIAMALVAFLIDISAIFSISWFVEWGALSLIGILLSRFAIAQWLGHALENGGALSRRVAIVGATNIAEKFSERMSEHGKGLTLVGVFDDRDLQARQKTPQKNSPAFEDKIGGNLAELIQLALSGDVDDIVICLPWSADNRIESVFHRLAVLPANIVVCPDMLWLNKSHGQVSKLAGVPVLKIHRRPLEGWGGVLKALEDRVLSFLFLLALAPIMGLVALAIKLDSRGPVFFRQHRHGFGHEEFKIYKFRTMRVAEDGDQVRQATKDDERVTRVGRFLRKYSLDELPQLINVLRGDMSLVGPRPHAIAHNAQYARVIADYAGRHKVKPGITGWAQVNGLRGETSETVMMATRVRFDLNYIEHWSLWFDLRIIMMTVWAVLFPKNAY